LRGYARCRIVGKPAGTPAQQEDDMQTIHWGQLCPAIRRALLREAVRRDVDVEVLFVALGGEL